MTIKRSIALSTFDGDKLTNAELLESLKPKLTEQVLKEVAEHIKFRIYFSESELRKVAYAYIDIKE